MSKTCFRGMGHRIRWAAIVFLAVAGPIQLFGQQATVTHNVNLRPTPSTAQTPKELLHASALVTLLDANPTQGYYHVRTQAGARGWVWGHNIAITAKSSAASVAVETTGAASPGEFASDKASCPAVGKHVVNGVLKAISKTSDDGLRNMAKRHIPVGTAPVTLDLAGFQDLQDDIDGKFGDARTTHTPFEPTRDALKNLKFHTNKSVSEGQLVQIAGFVTAVRGEGPESVNCRSTSVDDPASKDGTDIHINVGTKNSSEWKGIVVEMIPQLPRPAGWDTTTLKRLKSAKLQVLVAGGLTYDNQHLVNDDSGHPKTGQPKRISLWEIHPVTAFFVCEAASCDPSKHEQWATLAAWAKSHP